MDILNIILSIALVGTLNIVCFLIGFKLGTGERVMPISVENPIKAIKEHREEQHDKKEAEKEQKRIDTIMRNIERYDGTGAGQEDVPK